MIRPSPNAHGVAEGVNTDIMWLMIKYILDMLKTTVDQQKLDTLKRLFSLVTLVSHLFSQCS